MSPGTASASEPARSISATQLSSASVLRAVTTTFAPRWPAARAFARPRPLDAPVTTITCSLTGFLTMKGPYPPVKPLRFVHDSRGRHHRAHRDPDRGTPGFRAEAPPGDRALAREGHARVQGLDLRRLGRRQDRVARTLDGRSSATVLDVAR